MGKESRRGELRNIVFLVCAVLGPLLVLSFFVYLNVINKPSLSFETSSYPLDAGRVLVSLVVRNEGRASAEIVEMNVDVHGEIDNVWVQKGTLAAEIREAELFEESVDIDKKRSSCAIRVPYIANGMKYVVGLIVKPDDYQATYEAVVNSKNAGLAGRYGRKGGSVYSSAIAGFVAGLIVGSATLHFSGRIRQNRRSAAGTLDSTQL